jgi:hypothetical protein
VDPRGPQFLCHRCQAQELLTQLAINSPNPNGFVLDKVLIRKGPLIWIGNNSALQTKLIAAFHSSDIGGHSRVNATYNRLKNYFCGKE